MQRKIGKYIKFINAPTIRAEMARKQITQKSICEAVGWKSLTSFDLFINGQSVPTVPTCQKISEILEMNFTELFNIK